MIQVKLFDEAHEVDLEDAINKWIMESELEIIDIKFNSSICSYSSEQIYCFSALIIYYEKNPN